MASPGLVPVPQLLHQELALSESAEHTLCDFLIAGIGRVIDRGRSPAPIEAGTGDAWWTMPRRSSRFAGSSTAPSRPRKKLAAIRQVLQLDALTKWRPQHTSRADSPAVLRGDWRHHDDPEYP